MENDSTKLNTIGKAIAVFEAIRSANRALSIKELADALGLNKSSLHHHIKTLTEFGYLQQDSASRKYDIGLKLVSVGQTYLQRLDVRERGHLFLEQLSVELNETVHMLVLDHNQAVYVDKVEVQRPPGSLQCSSFIGMRTHLRESSVADQGSRLWARSSGKWAGFAMCCRADTRLAFTMYRRDKRFHSGLQYFARSTGR